MSENASRRKKPTEFCSAVVTMRHAHFACMKKSVAVHDGRGFCARHAPEFQTFYVYRVSGETVDKVLVFQRPGNQYSYAVVSPRHGFGSTLWARNWFLTEKEAVNAPLAEAQARVDEAKGDLARRIQQLKALRRLAK
jgi:hypothetical protein